MRAEARVYQAHRDVRMLLARHHLTTETIVAHFVDCPTLHADFPRRKRNTLDVDAITRLPASIRG
jgi:hypothetical protein